MVEKIIGRAREIGLSQAAVERACALSENRISKWAGGTGEPTARQLYRIARYIGCTVDYLLDDASDDPANGVPQSTAAHTAAKMADALELTESQVIRALNAVRPEERRPTADPPAIVEPVSAPRPGTLPALPPARSRSKGA